MAATMSGERPELSVLSWWHLGGRRPRQKARLLVGSMGKPMDFPQKKRESLKNQQQSILKASQNYV